MVNIQNRWAMYDWASSAYNLVITSTVFPTYFIAVTQISDKPSSFSAFGLTLLNTSWYSFILAMAFIIIAALLPIMSSLGDLTGNKRQFLRFFIYLGSFACMAMYFFTSSHIEIGFVTMAVASISFWLGNVFYNSYLVELAPKEGRNLLSAKGYAFGYVGSVILQLISFMFIIKSAWFGIDSSEGCRWSFIAVGLWWLLWGEYAIHYLPIHPKQNINNFKSIFVNGFKEVIYVLQQIKKIPIFKNYLFSAFLFSTGVQTIMLAATIYGKGELLLDESFLIILILIIQLIAIPGAYFIASLSNKIGNIKALIFCVSIWIFICIFAYFIPPKKPLLFALVGVLVGFVMGGIQSIGRSTYAKLVPSGEDITIYFSFYDFQEKIALVVGMLLYSIMNELASSQRLSIIFFTVIFIFSLFSLVKTSKYRDL
ncbi:MAG: MFS transporter [Sediminibacterium sp.]|nr:MFS transporter [Sediminibacterium sp.]